ncbi:putative proteasome endopeptidase complex [Helianthus debilis subsp. tardiflorus]
MGRWSGILKVHLFPGSRSHYKVATSLCISTSSQKPVDPPIMTEDMHEERLCSVEVYFICLLYRIQLVEWCHIYCCGAGTAADTEAVTDNISSQLKLHRYHTGRESRVVTALTLLKSHLFRYQGHVSAALVLGGVDVTGPHLHTIYPHGPTDTLLFATMGSGSLAAMAIFESEYREGLTREEGVNLVTKAICSGIFNDLGSGSNVDVCVIEKGKKEYRRNHLTPNPRTYISSKSYTFSKKTVFKG